MKTEMNHEEKVVGGNSSFLELLNKELEKQGVTKVDEKEISPSKKEKVEIIKSKPKKEFLKKGKKQDEL